MNDTLPQAILKPRKARPFYGRHPWCLDSAIERIEPAAADGDAVDLVSDKGKFVARGLYNGQSRIRIRLYTWQQEPLDAAFWRRRLAAAVGLRKDLGYDDPQGAARLVFSEGDGLSGLVVDRYGAYLAVQVTSLALAMRLAEIVPALVELVHPRGVVIRTERGMTQAEGLELRDGPYWGEMPDGPVFIEENGTRLGVDLAEGHKTGAYLDQRENRRATAGFLRGRPVLDMFCYTGWFSVAVSAPGGATEVLGVDSSQKAIDTARANVELNGRTHCRFQQGDAFEVMESLIADGQRFGGVILDPPKFARSRAALQEAMRAYHWLNRLAVQLLEPGGILVTCSCSGHVTREDFFAMLIGVAQQTGREIQVLQQRGAAPDHPVAVTCPEGEYLKCFVCRVV